MNPPAKLVAFLTLLAAVFGISYVIGTQSQALLAPVPTHNSEMVPPPGTVEGYARARLSLPRSLARMWWSSLP